MTAVAIVLGVMLLAAVGVAVWLYVRQREAEQRRPGAGISAIARGLLSAYAGGLAGGLS